MRCGSVYLARHGVVAKPLVDTKVNQVRIVSYRCAACGVTFRYYPDGVGRASQSHRTQALAAIMQALGLSCSITSLLLGIPKTTVWRDGRKLGMALRGRASVTSAIKVIGADETWVKVKGRPVCLAFVVDAETGETIGVDILVERDTPASLLWLRS